MKILINTPTMSLISGGVSNHYYGLQSYWTESVKYNIVGKRNAKKGSGKYWILWDVLKFSILLTFWHPDAVVLNPSMTDNALKRDLFFLKITKFFRKKVVLFIHGFHPEYCETIDTKALASKMDKADGVFVLAESYKNLLIQWGVRCPVMTTTTKVDDRLIEHFDVNERNGEVKNILFLSRVEKEKGIYEAIDAFQLIKEQNNKIFLTVVGQGTELDSAKQYVTQKGLSGVVFTGRLQGQDLINQYKTADIYIFPSYSEGMPTTVLEAMAFGLPIIARKVGGLVDFFEPGRMGFITDSYAPQVFAKAISQYIQNVPLTKEVSVYNHLYAKDHFLASKVAVEIENDIKKIINNQ